MLPISQIIRDAIVRINRRTVISFDNPGEYANVSDGAEFKIVSSSPVGVRMEVLDGVTDKDTGRSMSGCIALFTYEELDDFEIVWGRYDDTGTCGKYEEVHGIKYD